MKGYVITDYKFIRWVSTREEKGVIKLRDHVDVRTYGCYLAMNTLRLGIKKMLLSLQSNEIRQGPPTSVLGESRPNHIADL